MSGLPSAAAALGLRDVTKRYRTDLPLAVGRLTLDVPAGEVCVLVGSSVALAVAVTSDEVRKLNASVDLDKEDPDVVAKASLDGKGLLAK